jgi:hypothetical protein
MNPPESGRHDPAEPSTSAGDSPTPARTGGQTAIAIMPSKALAIRTPACVVHVFDRSRLTCQVCGLRIYVEVRIS